MLLYAFVLIILSILYIISTAISINCANNNAEYKTQHPTSFNFSLFVLILSIISLLGGFAMLYFNFT